MDILVPRLRWVVPCTQKDLKWISPKLRPFTNAYTMPRAGGVLSTSIQLDVESPTPPPPPRAGLSIHPDG
jgi:hypothetical protein